MYSVLFRRILREMTCRLMPIRNPGCCWLIFRRNFWLLYFLLYTQGVVYSIWVSIFGSFRAKHHGPMISTSIDRRCHTRVHTLSNWFNLKDSFIICLRDLKPLWLKHQHALVCNNVHVIKVTYQSPTGLSDSITFWNSRIARSGSSSLLPIIQEASR